ncbi:MAG TPA: TlpA disulfide reductase family protein [Acidobacteriaceae bacterium]
MTGLRSEWMIVLMFALPLVAHGQANPKNIASRIETLREQPDDKRPAVTLQLATDIRTLPPGMEKLKLADSLSHLATEGDPGQGTIQAVADALVQALKETPQPLDKLGKPAEPYVEVAKYVRYEFVTESLDDPQYTQAMQMLVDNDVDAAKADFTLKDIKGKAVTLSELKGKIVLVSFWATWCPPCRKEMGDLNAIYMHYQSQGLVILSVTNEDPMTVVKWSQQFGEYHPPVLLDEGGKVAKQYHVDGIPTTFVYNRDGVLVAKAIDMRTQRQFFALLMAAGLKPEMRQ